MAELAALTLGQVATNLQISKPYAGYIVVFDATGQPSAISIAGIDKTHVGLGNVQNLKENLVAGASPTSTDDSTDGYSVGSRWMYDTHEWVCVDASPDAAVWIETTGAGGSGSSDFDGNAYTLQVRGLPASTWTSNDPVLAVREFAVETDTGLGKIGDGTTAWTSLPYAWGVQFTPAHKTALEGATSALTPGAIVARDISGRFQASDPEADADVATKAFVAAAMGTGGGSLALIDGGSAFTTVFDYTIDGGSAL